MLVSAESTLCPYTLDQFIPSIVYQWAWITYVIDLAWIWNKHRSVLIIRWSAGEHYFLQIDKILHRSRWLSELSYKYSILCYLTKIRGVSKALRKPVGFRQLRP